MKLQRQASMDAEKALLGPIQPDLSGERVSMKKGFPEQRAKNSGNYITHLEDTKVVLAADGSPLPKEKHFFRKAVDHYLHGDAPQGHFIDPQEYREKVVLERPMRQSSETQTKTRVSAEYLRKVLSKDDHSEQRLALLSLMLDARVDHRSLMRLKQSLFDKNVEIDGDKDDAISTECFIQERKHFMKDMPEEVEKRILEEIAGPEDGTVSRKKLIELLDIYQFLPIRIKRDRNLSENLYYVLNSNKRG